MTINFTKAIELQTVRKLKSHAKVGYQDHPRGDKYCANCTMFVPGNPAACTHVAPPIVAQGYCDDHEMIDPNSRAHAIIGKEFNPDEPRDEKGKWTSGSEQSATPSGPKGHRRYWLYDADHNLLGTYEMLNVAQAHGMAHAKSSQETVHLYDSVGHRETGVTVFESGFNRAPEWRTDRKGNPSWRDTSEEDRVIMGTLKSFGKGRSFSEVMKAGPPDEPRDERGRWSAGGDSSSPPHPDWMNSDEGGALANAMAEVSSQMHEHADKVEEARQALEDASSHAEDISDEEDDALEHEPVGSSPQYKKWEQRNNAAQADVADKAMALHAAVAEHALASGHVLGSVSEIIAGHAATNGVRVGKVRKYGPSVSDVHPPTALGNDPGNWRPKWKDFLTTIAEIKGGGRIVQVNTDSAREAAMEGPPTMDFGKALEKIKSDALAKTSLAAKVAMDFGTALGVMTWEFADDGRPIPVEFGKNRIAPNLQWYADFEKRTVPVLFMRHGPTKFNNQTDMSKDRVRSWNNVPLTKEGVEDAEKAGEKLKDEDIGYIVSSDLGRAIQTSKIVGKAVGVRPVHDYDMRPWQLGKFTGMTTDEAHDGILHYVENPDEVVPEGESFNAFAARAVTGMLNAIKKAGKKKLLVVSHHRNERLFASMNPDGSVSAKKFMKAGEDPGDFVEMEFDMDELQNALRRSKGGRTEEKVGKVWGSNTDLPDGVRSVLPQEAQTVWRRVANDRIKAGQSEESAIKQAWTAVKNGWSKTVSGKWVRKSWLEPDGIYDFIEAEIAKLGGETSIAQPTDQINASLQLTPLDDRNARSPFPYDQYFFANLRNDQKERVLAALTDQDSLQIKRIPLSSLSAVQDRVDPGKIQSMLEGAPEKLAVVVRTGPGHYCIVDGHHRMTAALLSGVKTVPVKFMDIEQFDPNVHTDDNPGAKGEPVNKALERGVEFDIRKVDEDQQLVFGWASICSIDGEDVVDKQDDIIPEDELEKAAYDFALYCRQQGDMHERMGVGRLIESMMFTKQKQDAMGIDLGMVGWWVGFKVDDPGVWKRIKSGDLPEFSIGGKARREMVAA